MVPQIIGPNVCVGLRAERVLEPPAAAVEVLARRVRVDVRRFVVVRALVERVLVVRAEETFGGVEQDLS